MDGLVAAPAGGGGLHMWITFAVIAIAVGFYAAEKLALEIVSLAVVAAFLVLFAYFPLRGAEGDIALGIDGILAGFSNQALIAIVGLLIVGQALFQTGALNAPTRALLALSGGARRTMFVVLGLAMATSAFLNNTPVVVMFIPVLAAVSERLQRSPSHVMMPLSYLTILGGMTTLIGSSTNLLAAKAAERASGHAIGFFDFFLPGLALAAVGSIYVLFVMPRLLPARASMASEIAAQSGKQFIAQIVIGRDHPLEGAEPVAGLFPALKEMTVRLIQRDEHAFLPPFEDVRLRAGDVVIVAATRKTLTELMERTPGVLGGGDAGSEAGGPEQVLIEAVIAPGSRMIGRNLEQIGFRHQTGFIAVGLQRRSRMIRAAMNEIRLEAGDILLLTGPRAGLPALRAERDIILVETSVADLPDLAAARRARWVFVGVVLSAASGLAPVVLASLTGAFLMLALGCLNVRQAARAVDRRIVLLVAAALAMGEALDKTGGAAFLANLLVASLEGAGPAVILSAFFLGVVVITNILSNNATAVLFTPIAIGMAGELQLDPLPFIYAVIFAANCSFATPMGYQTNLLVMGPGHYRFSDYLRAGGPLALIIWVAWSAFAPWWFGF